MRTVLINDGVRSFTYAVNRGKHGGGDWPWLLLGEDPITPQIPGHDIRFDVLAGFAAYAIRNTPAQNYIIAVRHIIYMAGLLRMLEVEEQEYAGWLLDTYYVSSLVQDGHPKQTQRH